jgi:RecJ-like exonuclease
MPKVWKEETKKRKCQACKGTGKSSKNGECYACAGTGFFKPVETLEENTRRIKRQDPKNIKEVPTIPAKYKRLRALLK